MMIGSMLRCPTLDLVRPLALDARPLLSASRTKVRHRAISEKCHEETLRLSGGLVGAPQQSERNLFEEEFAVKG